MDADNARRLFIVAHNASPVLGGGETGVAALLGGLRERGHRVLMLCRDPGIAARVRERGVDAGVLRVGGDGALHHALRFAARMRALRPDALLLTTFKKVLLAGLGARLARVPRIVQRIGLSGDTPARGAHYRFALRRLVDGVALNAASLRAEFLAADPAFDPARCVVLYNGVRAPAPGRPAGAVRAEAGIPAGARVIGALARLTGQKRLDRLVDALALLPADVHLLVAGEGPARGDLLRRAAERGVADRLHLLGFRADVGDVLAAMDVYAVSSDREGMANAMLEAMASGIPVVSTPVSGADEALGAGADGEAPGVLVSGEGPGMTDALRGLLDAPGLRARMGRAGRRRVAERFDRERCLDAWEAALRPSRTPSDDDGFAR